MGDVVARGADDVAFRNPAASVVVVVADSGAQAGSWRKETAPYQMSAGGMVTFGRYRR